MSLTGLLRLLLLVARTELPRDMAEPWSFFSTDKSQKDVRARSHACV